MKTVLLINGHEYYEFSKGQYNSELFKVQEEMLSKYFNVIKTVVNDGYNIKEEQEKFKQADFIIFQFPIYFFNVPAALKKYMDTVYAYGVFFEGGSDNPDLYGFTNGLMTGKKYMLSVTSNAPEQAYGNPKGFFQGKDLEDFLFSIHKTHQFCGMESIKSFSANNVIKNPQLEKDVKALRKHLDENIIEPYAVWGSSCNK